ncbi:MAG: alkaline phosphatase family protein [Thermoanaerobaculia bacterium]
MRPIAISFFLLLAAAPIFAKQPVVIIGVDGATWAIARDLMKDGKMPVLASLVAKGASGDLGTLSPTLSPAIWTTIATGFAPEQHGIQTFVITLPDGERTLPRSTDWRRPAMWSIASDAGLRVGVVNWWATYPAEVVNGFIVSDHANFHRRFGYKNVLGLTDKSLGMVGTNETQPPRLLNRIVDVLGANLEIPPRARTLILDPMPPAVRSELERQPKLVRDQRLSVLKFVILQDHAAQTATRVALETMRPPDLLAVYFSGVDAAEHQFWAFFQPNKYPKPPPASQVAALAHVVPNYYRYMDSVIGDVLARAPKNAVIMIISDHGHEANPKYDPDALGSDYGRWTSGEHNGAPPGIVVISGPGVRPGRIAGATVFDVAPTVLALLGLPATTGMKGKVLETAFQPAMRKAFPKTRVARAARKPTFAKPRRSPADDELMEKLRALGYLQ